MDFLVEEELNKFKNKFKNLDKLEKGDKMYYQNNVIEIIKGGYLQGLTRFISFQDRYKFYDEFKKDIERLNKIIDNLIVQYNVLLGVLSHKYYLNFGKIKKLHQKILRVLSILIETYHDDKEYVKKLFHLIKIINRFYK